MPAAVPNLTKSIQKVNLHPDYERVFAKYTTLRPEIGCWEWEGKKNKQRYGTACAGGKRIFAHRLSWALHNGECPADRCVAHKCDNPICVRPDHLFLATISENTGDMWLKGRGITPDPSCNYLKKDPSKAYGSKNCKAKLTDAQVIEMRERHAAGESAISLAEHFKVNKTTAQRIVYGHLWKHLLK